MRGIGVGIFIAALILIIARINTPADISDAEIISRAHELGMIESDSMSLTESVGNNDTSDEDTSSDLYPVLVPTGNNSEQDAADPSGESSDVIDPDEQDVPDEQVEPDVQPEPDTPVEPDVQPEPDTPVEPDVQPEPDTQTEPVTQPEEVDYVILQVERGNSSNVVAEKLQRLGIIDNAKDFDNYLVNNGYANRISVGTFQIPMGSSYEWIAKKITNSL